VLPHYLTEVDHLWLRALLDEHHRFQGRRKRDLVARIREGLGTDAPRAKLRMAAHVLWQQSTDVSTSPVPPRQLRATVFRLAAEHDEPVALARCAEEHGLATEQVREFLFADVPDERRIGALREPLGPALLATLTNEALVASLLKRATRVSIVARGNARALVRHAKLVGLICLPSATPDTRGVRLHVSGPLALFRRTLVYGRALASLVPRVAWCDEFELRAECAFVRDGELDTLVVRSGDPIKPGRELKRFDSRLEQRFAEQFARRAPDWQILREPVPLRAGRTLVFPDFELRHRHDPDRRWLVEIVGFWTRGYLERKLAGLQAAEIENLILCVSERHACDERAWPANAHIVPFKTRIDPAAVLRIIESVPCAHRASTS
jgi:predicted nuclease of restriction endonuclease-like RecB superfamily